MSESKTHPELCPLFNYTMGCVTDCPWWQVAGCGWLMKQAREKQTALKEASHGQ